MRRGRAFAGAAAVTAATAAVLSSHAAVRARPPVRMVAHGVPAGAALVARRFLVFYARAYAGPLPPSARSQLWRIADRALAAVLVEQPPEVRLARGRLVSLRLQRVDARDCAGVASVSFTRARVTVDVAVSRDARAAWRVVQFEPAVTDP